MNVGGTRGSRCRGVRPLSKGISLAEVLIAVTVLGVVAAIATPHFASTNTQTLTLATQRVVDAIHFAQSEAIRTGKPYGITASTTDQHLKVYWWDDTGGTPVAVYNVYHPLSKSLYTVDFGGTSPFSAATIDAVSFKFESVATPATELVFAGGNGAPRHQPSVKMLETGTITLALGSEKQIVNVAPFTGRVTVQ